MKLSIIIPTYNKRKNLLTLVEKIAKTLFAGRHGRSFFMPHYPVSAKYIKEHEIRLVAEIQIHRRSRLHTHSLAHYPTNQGQVTIYEGMRTLRI